MEVATPKPRRAHLCMVCFQRASRYFGVWAEEGLCKPCVDAMRPDVRLRVIRDMHPEYRTRWQRDLHLTS